ncbi:flavonol synthase [Litorimonas cladophorae]|uniref:2-oxoglutarate-dependent ethylene/succinate-forming enzyme n=1 Tax=Litorimonas cladophorae TaxID=1220491 RepID=A0A918KU03_9PROT|nr:2-oxoglutarate and iron-dependent oxygenase domain-containing protein [Litorimonas cladophorae]GGX73632.1 flavonol synthase [Litorimonas cladophorae]
MDMTTIEIKPVSYNLWKTDKAAFAKAFGESFAETGFAVVSDHTIPQDIIDKAAEDAKTFFAQSPETKRKYADPDNGHQRGYSPIGSENAKGRAISDFKEFWHTGRDLPADSPYRAKMKDTPVVEELPEFNTSTRDLYEALDSFGADLLRAVALHLGLEESYFDDKVNNGNSILRMLHYPAHINPPPEGSVRAAAHEDINLITLLLGAEEAGLQAKHRNGTWLDVNAPKGALVVNAGDMLQRLTAWTIPSTTHRVLNPSAERAKFPRYSFPFFLHPNQDYLIDPLPNCVAKTGKVEAPITAEDYLTERLLEIGLLKK